MKFHGGKVELHAGDCLEVLRELPADSIDAVVTDPPYHLTSIVKRFGGANAAPAKGNEAFIRASRGFMGKIWDDGDIAFTVELWSEVLRVLKPGGHMVCFGGTRTYHRLACAIEDAGFEIRDAIMWHYGSGFPKSHNVSLGIDKGAGAIGARGSAINFAGKGERADIDTSVSALNGKLQPGYNDPITDAARQWQGYGTALKPSTEIICLARKPLSESTVAANVLRWGTGALNIDGCRVEAADGYAENTVTQGINTAQTSYAPAVVRRTFEPSSQGRWPANLCHDGSPEVLAGFPDRDGIIGACFDKKGGFGYNGGGSGAYREGVRDTGSAARFFYTAKADWDDRLNSKHPTVKPVDLMQWLVRLVCPKGATVLDPFAGTGTTGAASFIEGRRCVLIEREAEYLADIERRMDLLLSGPDERARKLAKPEPIESLPLFGAV